MSSTPNNPNNDLRLSTSGTKYYNLDEEINSERDEIFKSCHELSQEILSSTFETIGHSEISENTSNIEKQSSKQISKEKFSKITLSLPTNSSNIEIEEQTNFSSPEARSIGSSSKASLNSIDVSEASDTKNVLTSGKVSVVSAVTIDVSVNQIDVDSIDAILNDLDVSEKKVVIYSAAESSKSIRRIDTNLFSTTSEASHLRSVSSEASSIVILTEEDATHRNIKEVFSIPIQQTFNSHEELNTSEDIASIDANVKANETIQSNRDTNSLFTLYADSMFDSNYEEDFREDLGEDELYARNPSSSKAYKFSDPLCMERSSNASMIAVLDFDLYGCNDLTDTTSQVAGSSKD